MHNYKETNMRRGKWFLPQRRAAHGGKQECRGWA